MKLVLRFFSGFALGWVVYMVAMLLATYDGVLSLIFQPLMATRSVR